MTITSFHGCYVQCWNCRFGAHDHCRDRSACGCSDELSNELIERLVDHNRIGTKNP